MKRRYVLTGLAAIAIFAIASPALGGPSLKSLVKKEVKKQLAGKTGPAGANGTNGSNGANGTARAFGYVDKFFCGGGFPATCTSTDPKSSNVTSIQQVAAGRYCVTVSGISSDDTVAVATVDNTESFPGNASNAVAFAKLGSVACPTPKFEFDTFDPADPTANVDTSFTFVIP